MQFVDAGAKVAELQRELDRSQAFLAELEATHAKRDVTGPSYRTNVNSGCASSDSAEVDDDEETPREVPVRATTSGGERNLKTRLARWFSLRSGSTNKAPAAPEVAQRRLSFSRVNIEFSPDGVGEDVPTRDQGSASASLMVQRTPSFHQRINPAIRAQSFTTGLPIVYTAGALQDSVMEQRRATITDESALRSSSHPLVPTLTTSQRRITNDTVFYPQHGGGGGGGGGGSGSVQDRAVQPMPAELPPLSGAAKRGCSFSDAQGSSSGVAGMRTGIVVPLGYAATVAGLSTANGMTQGSALERMKYRSQPSFRSATDSGTVRMSALSEEDGQDSAAAPVTPPPAIHIRATGRQLQQPQQPACSLSSSPDYPMTCPPPHPAAVSRQLRPPHQQDAQTVGTAPTFINTRAALRAKSLGALRFNGIPEMDGRRPPNRTLDRQASAAQAMNGTRRLSVDRNGPSYAGDTVGDTNAAGVRGARRQTWSTDAFNGIEHGLD